MLRAIAIFELHQATICKAIDMKMIFFLMEIELIFTTKVLHLVMFWKWEFLELRNAPFKTSGSHLARLCSKWDWEPNPGHSLTVFKMAIVNAEIMSVNNVIERTIL